MFDIKGSSGEGEIIPPPQKVNCPYQWVSASLCFELDWLTDIKVNQEARVLLTILGEDPAVWAGSVIQAKLWMPEHGHGSAPVKVELNSQGEFELSNLWFIMPGKWSLHLEIYQENRLVDEYVLPIEL